MTPERSPKATIMEGKRLIHRLRLKDFLSYGNAGVEIDLQPLNVLIGPNASGKSNLIEALGVLRAAPTDLPAYFRERGGIGEYIRRGEGTSRLAEIEAWVDCPNCLGAKPLRHRIELADMGQRLEVRSEDISAAVYSSRREFQLVYELTRQHAEITAYDVGADSRKRIPLERTDLKRDQSILSQRRDPLAFPELTHLASQYERIELYQEWMFGRRSRARTASGADMPTDFLLPDASNLGLILHDLMQASESRNTLLKHLKLFYDTAEFIPTKILSGAVQLFIDEGASGLVPAMRLSDGTLRYLSLLAILCHPSPPPLVCIEEPELGLHPDIVPTVVGLLKKATERTQLVVTTHSDALVSALSDQPETVIVCEAGIDGTSLRRLDREGLATWLEKYSLGEVWRAGEIGGNRW
jgi:predicted ATPase